MKSLSDLVKEENKRNREIFLNSKDKNINYYYEDKKERIKNGKEEVYNINEEEEE